MKINEFSQPQLAKFIKSLQRNISMNCFSYNNMRDQRFNEQKNPSLKNLKAKQINGTLKKSNIKNMNDNPTQNTVIKIRAFQEKERSKSIANIGSLAGLPYNSISFVGSKKSQQINNRKVLERLQKKRPSEQTKKSEELKQNPYRLARHKSFKKDNLKIITNQICMLKMCQKLGKEDLNQEETNVFNNNDNNYNNRAINDGQNSQNLDYQTFRNYDNRQEIINQTNNYKNNNNNNKVFAISNNAYVSNMPKPQKKISGKICIKSLKKEQQQINLNVLVDFKVNGGLNEITQDNERERNKIIEENNSYKHILSKELIRPKSLSRINPISITGSHSKINHPITQEKKILIPQIELIKEEKKDKGLGCLGGKLKLSPNLKKVIKQKSVERLNRKETFNSKKNLNLAVYAESQGRTTRIPSLYNTGRNEIIREIPTPSIKNYKIVKEIGQGAFGRVVLALHIYSNIRVAIKILDKNLLTDTPMKNRISNEIYVHRKMHHPGIIKLYEMFESNDYIFIVLEYGQSINK